MSRRWLALLLLGAALFALLRGIAGGGEPAVPSPFGTPPVVVVGVPGRTTLTDVDEAVLRTRAGDVQAGSISVRTRYLGDCAAAGWTTLGAGRRAAVAGLCDPEVVGERVTDWPARQAAAAARRGDARLGTLAASVQGCVAAVGPGAALAAARPDGSLAGYRSAEQFLADGLSTVCPTTLVDAGPRSDEVIARLAGDPGRTLVVAGIGPVAGSTDPALQAVYRTGATPAGWLTSASTRRQGVVTLTDLTRTLVEHDAPPGAAVPVTIDGAPWAVDRAEVTDATAAHQLASVTALSDAAVTGYLVTGGLGTVLFLGMVVQLLRRRWALPWLVMAYGSVLPAVMMLPGALPWAASQTPGLAVGVLVLVWSVVLTGLVLVLSRRLRVPAAVVGSAVVLIAFTVDAALGAPVQAGSLLNSRPVYGLRWYGFGNVTFAAYATAGLFCAGYLAHRLLAAGRRRAAVAGVALVGLTLVVCQGWPTMGADFGGVVALTPAVLWLLLTVSGVRVTGPRLLAVGVSAVVAVGTVSLLDWSRGPDRRSHLGNFVQRVLDGDALDVVARKAVASAETIVSPLGIGSIVLGAVAWVLVVRYALPVLTPEFSTLRPVLVAALGTAVLGTLLNDGGSSVWLTVTSLVSISVLWFCLDRALRPARPEPIPRVLSPSKDR